MIGFFDSSWLAIKNYRYLIGIGISCSEERQIEEVYWKLTENIRQCLRSMGYEYWIVKSDHISKLLPKPITIQFYMEFLDKMVESTLDVHVTVSHFRKPREELIKTCRDLGIGKSTMDIMNKVSQFYPLVTLDSTLRRRKLREAYIDEIHGLSSAYWDNILNKVEKLIVIPRGDFQYEGLALADITLTAINILSKQHKSIENIHRMLIDKGITTELIPMEEIIHNIVNIQTIERGVRMNVGAHRPHPQILILLDKSLRENVYFEWTNAMSIVYRKARKMGGYAKIFSPPEDTPYISKEDIIVVVGSDPWINKTVSILSKVLNVRVYTLDKFLEL